MDDSDKISTENATKLGNTPHSFTEFDRELKNLRSQLLLMAQEVSSGLNNALEGLLTPDLSLCNEVIAADEVVDQLEKEIDEIGMHIIMRFKPVATDLRRVFSTMNMSRMLERIGDHAVNVAKRGRKILKIGPLPETEMLSELSTAASEELRNAITAFAEENSELALSLESRDKELDRTYKQVTKSLTALIEERQDGTSSLIHLLFVARSLERIGDLSVNLGEEIVFIHSAEDIRHTNR